MNDGGTLKVELQDAEGKALPGFSLANSDAFAGDSTAAKMSWGGKSDLSSLAGKPLRVRYELSKGDLYSMRFR